MSTQEAAVRPVVLIIRDGWGRNPNADHNAFNAIKLATTPVADRLEADWPTTLIKTCGEDVGLPVGTMGNSEVGHQNIGAGRIVDQEVMRITRAIRDETFFANPALHGAFAHAIDSGGRVHLMGLVSDGKVHSDLDHLLALIDMAKKEDVPADRLLVHAITDGRDTPPRSGVDFISRLQAHMKDTAMGRIATVIGRYYAMDRDHRWERIEQAYHCLTNRVQSDELEVREALSAIEAVQAYYDNPSEHSRQGDEFVLPTRILAADDNDGLIRDGDAVIFFNFRGDRPRELSRAFVLDDNAWADVQEGGFARGDMFEKLYFCTMTGYESSLPVTAIAFPKPSKMPNILGNIIAEQDLTQFRCAETEKFPHVTFFFNDYREEPFEKENRLLVPSPQDVTTYDQKPEMSALAVCEGVLERMNAKDCEAMIIVNFANGDMVGHTGSLDATVKAIEIVDECVGRIVDATLERGGALIVTADHGNAEQMYDPVHDSPHTAHTTFDVPLHIVGTPFENATLISNGRLADIAPTMLRMLGIVQPEEMTGRVMIQE